MAVLGLAPDLQRIRIRRTADGTEIYVPGTHRSSLSLEPLFSALFAFLFLQETLSAKGYFGAALMMAGVLVASASPEKAAQTAQN